MMRLMHEKDKAEFLRKRKEEQERLQLEDEALRKAREEEVARAIEEAKLKAMEEFLKNAEIERQKVIHARCPNSSISQSFCFVKQELARMLARESHYFDYAHHITRAFVFSFYDLLRYLQAPPGKPKLPKIKPAKTPN